MVRPRSLDIGAIIRRLIRRTTSPMPMGDAERRRATSSSCAPTCASSRSEEIENYPITDALKLEATSRASSAPRACSDNAVPHRRWLRVLRHGVERQPRSNVVESTQSQLDGDTSEEIEKPTRSARWSDVSYMVVLPAGRHDRGQRSASCARPRMWGVASSPWSCCSLFLRRVRLTLCVALAIPVSARCSRSLGSSSPGARSTC